MALVLTPILKSASMPTNRLATNGNPKVTFILPEDTVPSVIEHLSDENAEGAQLMRFHTIMRAFLNPETKKLTLITWMREFRDNISFLGKQNERLALCLLKMNWSVEDDEFATVYRELVLNLVSAHWHTYLRPVLTMIIRIFMTEADDRECVSEEEIKSFHNAHELLRPLLVLIPTSPEMLCTMLLHKFPYQKRSAHVFECYVRNMLTVCSYLPSKRPLILENLIAKVIRIDVHCSREVIEITENERENEEEKLFSMEQEGEVEPLCEDKLAYPIAHNLDIIMNCIFKFIQNTCVSTEGTQLNWEVTKKLYKEILTIFDKVILPTRECSHIQFTLLYMSSLKPELCEGFFDFLWKKVQNPSVSPIIRQSAAFYIGSLLARATYITVSIVMSVLDMMCDWIHRYIDAQDLHGSQDIRVHGTFHSVCQSIFYVFAFRHKEIMDMPMSHKSLRSLNLERIITCRLNPLKFCDRTIVQNFANIARNYQVAYCYPVIEKNNRSLLCLVRSGDPNIVVDGLSGSMIQTFFPFDPYLLKRSKCWIERLYRIYNCNKEDAMEEEEECTSVQETASTIDLFSYGSSPGFKLSRTSPRQFIR